MLGNILPVVHGPNTRRSRRVWFLMAALYSLGNVLSAAAVGGLLASLAWMTREAGFETSHWTVWSCIAIALIYLPRQLGWTRIPPLLQSRRQVPRTWAYDYPRWASALFFGLGLGTGFYTRIVVPSFYLLVLWPFLTGGWTWPVLTWTAYGFSRSLHVWLLALTTPPGNPYPRAHELMFELMRWAGSMRRAQAIMLVLLSVWLGFWGGSQ